MKISYGKLIGSILLCQLAGIIGSLFTVSSVSGWYPILNKPAFTPPSWLFGSVWSILFLLMGVSFYIIWNEGMKTRAAKRAVFFFILQLFLNVLWSILFFGLKSPLYALIEILFLWTSILLTGIYFYRISKTAAYLLIPYLLWVSFAIVLNGFIVYLN